MARASSVLRLQSKESHWPSLSVYPCRSSDAAAINPVRQRWQRQRAGQTAHPTAQDAVLDTLADGQVVPALQEKYSRASSVSVGIRATTERPDWPSLQSSRLQVASLQNATGNGLLTGPGKYGPARKQSPRHRRDCMECITMPAGPGPHHPDLRPGCGPPPPCH